MTKPKKIDDRWYVESVGDFVLDHLPESDERAERVLAYVRKHMPERHATFPRYKRDGEAA